MNMNQMQWQQILCDARQMLVSLNAIQADQRDQNWEDAYWALQDLCDSAIDNLNLMEPANVC